MCITEIFYEAWAEKSRSKPCIFYLSRPYHYPSTEARNMVFATVIMV